MDILITNTQRINEYISGFNAEVETLDQFAIIEAPKGIVVAQNDSVHYIAKNEADVVIFDLVKRTKKDGGGEIVSFLFGQTALFPIKELKRMELLDKVDLNSFINNTQGNRRRANYRLLVETLKELGVDNPSK